MIRQRLAIMLWALLWVASFVVVTGGIEALLDGRGNVVVGLLIAGGASWFAVSSVLIAEAVAEILSQ